jgi:hypothetical protein
MTYLAAFLLLAAASSPTPKQHRALARILVCPERLADDAARIRNTDAFFALYAKFQPDTHAGTRMAYRDTLLRQKKCKPQDRALIHTFPET